LFDLNVAAQEFDGGRQKFGENAIEAMFEERLSTRVVCKSIV